MGVGLESWESVGKCNADYNTRNFKRSTEGYGDSQREGSTLGWGKEGESEVTDVDIHRQI